MRSGTARSPKDDPPFFLPALGTRPYDVGNSIPAPGVNDPGIPSGPFRFNGRSNDVTFNPWADAALTLCGRMKGVGEAYAPERTT